MTFSSRSTKNALQKTHGEPGQAKIKPNKQKLFWIQKKLFYFSSF